MKSILVSFIVVLVAASGLSAQQRLTRGQRINSQLDTGSLTLRDNSYYELYRYDSPGNEAIELTMTSTEFDTYVMIGRMEGGTFVSLGSDDDSGDGTDSRLKLTLTEAGTYFIRANSDNAAETGSYTIRLTSDANATAYPEAPLISVGDRITGVLTTRSRLASDDSHYDPYLIEAVANTTVHITMESDDFDAYLVIGRPGDEFETLESDDDGAGGTNSQLVFTFPDSGTYEIRANTLTSGEVGTYVLTLEVGQPPVEAPFLENPRLIGIDAELTGEFSADSPMLGDDSHFEDFVITGVPGSPIVIRLLSDDFDSYLEFGYMVNGDFVSIEMNDDCMENETNSCITFTFEDDRQYVIRANTLNGGETGAYRLTVTRRD